MWFTTRKWLPGVALATLAAVVLILSSCGGPSSSPPPTPTPRPTVMPTRTPCGASRWGFPAWRAWIGWQVQRFGVDCPVMPALTGTPVPTATPAPTGTPVPQIVVRVEVKGDCNILQFPIGGYNPDWENKNEACRKQVIVPSQTASPTATPSPTPTNTPTATSRWVPYTATPTATLPLERGTAAPTPSCTPTPGCECPNLTGD